MNANCPGPAPASPHSSTRFPDGSKIAIRLAVASGAQIWPVFGWIAIWLIGSKPIRRRSAVQLTVPIEGMGVGDGPTGADGAGVEVAAVVGVGNGLAVSGVPSPSMS